ncbi:uncharacterized protein PGTG_07372 [Puccinia graminis f. sp. tritici CRL 75-36-700-3]|uniref:Uncharacterized protein n=1 Tax=Puccinia graminis f. sp. tritici (strain CRL 75-36-700-3 / race SCCL) TaxID=418459 RepID=E3K9M4_PUCGT|nr:uncharacterized protein PGTG_07372 [Puccinia graminis f. sp. tritici CRL 75-36-700-3]EFP81120.1 hypothetical protein PGTG_07372 [Puccinia graminis f. sp. tritici CRL 75-36-700-3]
MPRPQSIDILHLTMLDSENTRILESDVCEAFESLSESCRRRSSTPDYDDRKPKISTKQINVLKSLLIKMRTTLLPSLRQRMADLLVFLDASHFPKDPQANLRATLEITSQLADILVQIRAAVRALTLARLRAFEYRDDFHGIAKIHRTEPFLEKVDDLINFSLCAVFERHVEFVQGWNCPSEEKRAARFDERSVSEETTITFELIDELIRLLTKSDFGNMQDTWQLTVTRQYDIGLANLIEHIIIQSDQARNPAKTDLSDIHTPTIKIGPVQTARSRELTLLRSALPFVKLGRLFFSKLLVTPISRPPFTIKDIISSVELGNLKNKTYLFSDQMSNFTERLNY